MRAQAVLAERTRCVSFAAVFPLWTGRDTTEMYFSKGVPIDFEIVNDGSHQRVRTPVKRSELIIVALAFTALDDWAGLAIALSFYGQIT